MVASTVHLGALGSGLRISCSTVQVFGFSCFKGLRLTLQGLSGRVGLVIQGHGDRVYKGSTGLSTV